MPLTSQDIHVAHVFCTAGLDADWAVRMVKSVGNYGEMYESDLGSGSPLQLPRGLTALWSHGRLL